MVNRDCCSIEGGEVSPENPLLKLSLRKLQMIVRDERLYEKWKLNLKSDPLIKLPRTWNVRWVGLCSFDVPMLCKNKLIGLTKLDG